MSEITQQLGFEIHRADGDGVLAIGADVFLLCSQLSAHSLEKL
jgi:hypothetical protein